MQRRTYTVLAIFLALVRLWFALSPSYLHPDENFQGPEVIAGQIFSYPVRRTWEFDSERPIRSVFPLWPVYGLPMLLLRWIWAENGRAGHVAPELVFWTLRVLMFALSFVLEDWALHELIPSPRQRRVALLLVASSYVTWTYQTHTFSNSVETLVVAWSLVLIQRLVESRTGPAVGTSALLGVVAAFGFFNRITFPAFLLVPAVRLMPHLYHRPLALFSLIGAGLATTILAIVLDTEFYTPAHQLTWTSLLTNPVITPLNNILYNMDVDNLARHGLHPPYQHVVANLPLLIGPAMPLLLLGRPHLSDRLYSAISGVAVLSAFRHQEARFLLPAVPLILSSVRLPRRPAALRVWVGVWVAFNAVLGVLMGVYHQGGVVPGQVFISGRADATTAVWWKTYTPPIWLLDGKNEVLTTRDVMGMRGEHLLSELAGLATCDSGDGGDGGDSGDSGDGRSDHSGLAEQKNGTYLIAPASADWLDPHLVRSGAAGLRFGEVWRYRRHLNLDDLDFASDGVWNTLARVVGRRGLVAWRVTKSCGTDSRGELAGGDPAAGSAASNDGLDSSIYYQYSS